MPWNNKNNSTKQPHWLEDAISLQTSGSYLHSLWRVPPYLAYSWVGLLPLPTCARILCLSASMDTLLFPRACCLFCACVLPCACVSACLYVSLLSLLVFRFACLLYVCYAPFLRLSFSLCVVVRWLSLTPFPCCLCSRVRSLCTPAHI